MRRIWEIKGGMTGDGEGRDEDEGDRITRGEWG